MGVPLQFDRSEEIGMNYLLREIFFHYSSFEDSIGHMFFLSLYSTDNSSSWYNYQLHGLKVDRITIVSTYRRCHHGNEVHFLFCTINLQQQQVVRDCIVPKMNSFCTDVQSSCHISALVRPTFSFITHFSRPCWHLPSRKSELHLGQ